MSGGLDRKSVVNLGPLLLSHGSPWVETDMALFEKIMGYRLAPRRFYGVVFLNFMIGFWSIPRRVYRADGGGS